MMDDVSGFFEGKRDRYAIARAAGEITWWKWRRVVMPTGAVAEICDARPVEEGRVKVKVQASHAHNYGCKWDGLWFDLGGLRPTDD